MPIKVPIFFGYPLDVAFIIKTYGAHIREPFLKIALRGRFIDADEAEALYQKYGGNSYEQHLVTLFLEPTSLICHLQNILNNCQRVSTTIPGCYDEAVVMLYAPLLAQHLERIIYKKSNWQKFLEFCRDRLDRYRMR